MTKYLPIKNIAAYQFVTLDADMLPALRTAYKSRAIELGIRGTILLSTEGINLFLAGEASALDSLIALIEETDSFKKLDYKVSWSEHIPFTRMLVKLKREIISIRKPEVDPESHTAPYLAPEVLKQWYQDGKDFFILDTRNDYEVRVGSFENAKNLNIENFTDFPEAIKKLPQDLKKKPVVTFCTGGIRCEKAAELMLQQGYENVYQLEGGILRYFEHCGGAYYQGECFVFDQRVAVDSNLKETETIQCFKCRNPITLEEQMQSPGICPYHENERQA